jgi:SAM-dependent methyltransferase|tara:strand:+ start:76 stop:708 length:633 start_codon:yes stop_codon:yes gene_type:complete
MSETELNEDIEMESEEQNVNPIPPAWEGETGAVRKMVLPYIELAEKVCDIGFGGVLIIPEAIGIDLPQMYDNREHLIPPDIECDVSEGIPVEDDFFDVCYSSHLIEDFEDTAKALVEFIRILKNNGTLVLVFPDQQKYESLTPKNVLNQAHIHKDMGLSFMKNVLQTMPQYKFNILFESDCQNDWLPFEKRFSPISGYNVVMVITVQKDH